jgi:hypothetical protein
MSTAVVATDQTEKRFTSKTRRRKAERVKGNDWADVESCSGLDGLRLSFRSEIAR